MSQKCQCASHRLRVLVFASALFFCFAASGFTLSPATLSDENGAAAGQPDYNTILAEKVLLDPLLINSEARAAFLDAALNPQGGRQFTLRDEAGDLAAEAGWDIALSGALITGPFAQYVVSQSRNGCLSCDSAHDMHAVLGWRLDSRFGWIQPFAELRYRHPLADSAGSTSYENREGQGKPQDSGVDVSVGAHLPLNDTLAAFASLSQSDALNSGEQFISGVGVSASF